METDYAIKYSPLASSQLQNILLKLKEYHDTATALDRFTDIRNYIDLLRTSPYMGLKPRYRVLYQKGLRLLFHKQLVIIYYVDENVKTINIRAIFDQRQDYVNILNGL